MIPRKFNRVKILIASFMLVLFAAYYGSANFFYHTHTILGETITHSHPYKSDSNGKPIHNHSEKGYITIQFITSFLLLTILTVIIIDSVYHTSSEVIVITGENREHSSSRLVYSLRAPPVYML
jgi:hypothetical protein